MDRLRTAAEIVRVHLTESMIQGVIDKREQFLNRLLEVQGLRTARVVRSTHVNEQFGAGMNREMNAAQWAYVTYINEDSLSIQKKFGFIDNPPMETVRASANPDRLIVVPS